MKKIGLLFLLLIGFLSSAYAENFDRSAEVAEYIDIIRSDNLLKSIDALQEIYYSGITDRQLFDLIRQNLVKEYPALSREMKIKLDYTGWMIKALASSGIADYEGLLREIQSNSKMTKVRNHANHQAAKMAWYAERNAIMASKDNHVPDGSPHISRHINLLKADNLLMKRYAAERSSWEKFSEVRFFDAVEQEMLKLNEEQKLDKLETDTLSWFCKVLGYSGNAKYKDSIGKVLNKHGKNQKVKKYAVGAYKSL